MWPWMETKKHGNNQAECLLCLDLWEHTVHSSNVFLYPVAATVSRDKTTSSAAAIYVNYQMETNWITGISFPITEILIALHCFFVLQYCSNFPVIMRAAWVVAPPCIIRHLCHNKALILVPPTRDRTQISLLSSWWRLFPLWDITGPHTRGSAVLVVKQTGRP